MAIGLARTGAFTVFERSPLVSRQLHFVDVGAMQRIAGSDAEPIRTYVVGRRATGRRGEAVRRVR
jgi:hypothetical protein